MFYDIQVIDYDDDRHRRRRRHNDKSSNDDDDSQIAYQERESSQDTSRSNSEGWGFMD